MISKPDTCRADYQLELILLGQKLKQPGDTDEWIAITTLASHFSGYTTVLFLEKLKNGKKFKELPFVKYGCYIVDS